MDFSSGIITLLFQLAAVFSLFMSVEMWVSAVIVVENPLVAISFIRTCFCECGLPQ